MHPQHCTCEEETDFEAHSLQTWAERCQMASQFEQRSFLWLFKRQEGVMKKNCQPNSPKYLRFETWVNRILPALSYGDWSFRLEVGKRERVRLNESRRGALKVEQVNFERWTKVRDERRREGIRDRWLGLSLSTKPSPISVKPLLQLKTLKATCLRYGVPGSDVNLSLAHRKSVLGGLSA